ncbi:AzlC family ABC transporter permease [Haloimpatiens sp. FM7315]|uniref:AzlC family ABC transporter permease n=1 Tax=Haloimpatiens sp. FM7315 TaxID=3298609 RepID=UPI0035A2AAE4
MKNDYALQNDISIGNSLNYNSNYFSGLKTGLPICLGYIPVAFTFGIMAVNGGIPVWLTIFISVSNLTSAGQFAGTNLIISNASLVEIAFTTFIINIRYFLMSLSLSQKLESDISLSKKSILAFGITDEIFSIAAMEKDKLTFSYMMGLITGPFLGWSLGTVLGAVSCSHLPKLLQSSMGIALYAMFIALLVPSSKKSKAAACITLTAIFISCAFTWLPILNTISGGWRIMIATIAASVMGAILFPREGEDL